MGGFQFVEGPVWKTGYGLIFSDMNFSDMTKGKANMPMPPPAPPRPGPDGSTT